MPYRSVLACLGFLGVVLPLGAVAQTGRMVKVVVETRQQGTQSAQGVQGSGGVVVQGGSARARGGVAAQDTTTKSTRTSGVFVLVMDGGAGSMLVAQDVPYSQVAYYYDYATGKGHVAQNTAWQRVGTSLIVRPTILSDKQVRLRLTPSLSYFTQHGGGTIELIEAATELIVPSGRRMSLGGATSGMHSIARQILGVREEQSSSETGITLVATIQ
jgi:type II secretory pathway component GspD/PulD (secretin)